MRNPINRLGDFYGDQMKKLEFVLETAVEHGCEAILQPGDLGDSSNWSNYLKSQVISLLRHYGVQILCVSGQHDQKYHSLQSMDRTSLRVLEAAEVVGMLSSIVVSPIKGVWIYGSSFGEDWFGDVGKLDGFNILVIHRMILKDSKRLWPTQRDYAMASIFMRQHSEFGLIVSGDNHQGFIVEGKDQLLVNCGALVRAEASRYNVWEHKPFVVVYDTDTRKYEQIFIPIKPAEEVLNRERIEQVQERDERLEAFVEGLSTEYSVQLDFRANLGEFLKENKVRLGVKDIFKEVLSENNIR